MIETTREQGLSFAELARRAGIPETRVRKYVSTPTANPRGKTLELIARALAVNYVWLRDGIGEKYPGSETDETLSEAKAKSDAQLEFGSRVRAAREGLGMTVERATSSLAMTESRWTSIENGTESPSLIDLQAIADRTRESLDWLVCGMIPPEGPATTSPDNRQKTMHETKTNFSHRLAGGVKK